MKKLLLQLSATAVLTFPFAATYAQSELQVIHNCADPAAATVDIYVNGVNAIDDFAFRTATPFILLPSGTPLEIGVAPGNSSSVNDTLINFTVTLAVGEKYIAIANGVLSPASFAVNPDGLNTGFGLTIIPSAQLASQQPANVDLAVNHGSIDAPAVDVIARGIATLVNDAAYGDATGYLELSPGNYILDITPASNNTVIVASFVADLTTLAGGAGVVFASGFLDPASNQNGEAFGLFVAFPNGAVAALPAVSQARLQAIHNAADPGATSVDVYVEGALAIPAFAFRTATPFLDLPAGVPVNIGIAGPGSASVNDTIVNFTIELENGQTYVAIANGVLTPAAFAPNPDNRPIGFTLFISDNIRESALNAGEVDFIAIHGATDAPTVDVQVSGGPILIEDATYGDITSYLNVPAASYILEVTPGNNNTTVVASYTADLTTLAGGSAVVFASGFLDPSSNQNGEAFGLWVTLADGTTFPLPVFTSIGEVAGSGNFSMYPNPVNVGSPVSFFSDLNSEMNIEMINFTGQIVNSFIIEGNAPAKKIETSGLSRGVYMIKTTSGTTIAVSKLVVQ